MNVGDECYYWDCLEDGIKLMKGRLMSETIYTQPNGKEGREYNIQNKSKMSRRQSLEYVFKDRLDAIEYLTTVLNTEKGN